MLEEEKGREEEEEQDAKKKQRQEAGFPAGLDSEVPTRPPADKVGRGGTYRSTQGTSFPLQGVPRPSR